MSVIVKGMEMPLECRKCFAMDYGTMTGETYCKVNGKTLAESYRPIGFDGRPDWCPLVELKPHGRLIDADELKRTFDIVPAGRVTRASVRTIINHTATIVEAEGVEE